jgi:ribosome-associated protein
VPTCPHGAARHRRGALASPAPGASLVPCPAPGPGGAYLGGLILSHSDPATGLPVGPRATPADAGSEAVLARVLASLDDDKAEDIVQIDLRGRSDVADWMVIASGRSTRQVAAISEKLTDRLKDDLGIRARVEGKEASDWVLIDAGDVIVHVFRPEVRSFYQLEKMWMPAGQQAARVAPV